MNIPHRILLVAVPLVAATAAISSATMVQQLPLSRITRDAARIVRGTVTDVRSARDASGLPATWVTVDVSETLKGRKARRFTFKQYGVATPLSDGTLTRIVGLPTYRTGEEVVLFLHANSRRGFTSPVGLGQGAYRVTREGPAPKVRRALGGQPRRLDEFLATVRQLAPVPQ